MDENEVRKITREEIAKLFGVSPEKLDIKTTYHHHEEKMREILGKIDRLLLATGLGIMCDDEVIEK